AAAHAGPHKRGPALAVVERLLAAGAPDDVFTRAALGRVEALREDLARPGLDVDARGPAGCTALALAARGAHLEVVRSLLDVGADPDAPSGGGRTAWQTLMAHAWSAPHREVARLLLDRGARCSFIEAC